MSDKKGLSAFINKNKKSKKTKGTQEQVLQKDAEKAQEAQVSNEQETSKKNTPGANQDSSDEEVDELEQATQQLDYANIKENKDVSGGNMGEEKKQGFGYDEQANEQTQKTVSIKDTGAKKFGADAEIKFSRPVFKSNKPKKFGNKGDFDAGLDDLDEGDSKTKSVKDGQREFVNLGSTAKSGLERNEETPVEKKAPVKPTFKGRMNLAGTGGRPDDNNEGVAKSYDFRSNVYKQVYAEGEEGEKRERRDNNEERKFGQGATRGGHYNRDKGQAFGSHNPAKNDDDDGFQIVRNKDRKIKKKTNNDSSSDEDEKDNNRGNKGDFRGFGRGGSDTRGRGGFSESGFSRRAEGESIGGGARVERGGTRGARGGAFERTE